MSTSVQHSGQTIPIFDITAPRDLAGFTGPCTTNSSIDLSDLGSPTLDNDSYSGSETDRHDLFALSHMTLLEQHHLDISVQPQDFGQSPSAGQTQVFSAFEFEHTQFQPIFFSQAPPPAVMHNWEPDILLDSDMPPTLDDILQHDDPTSQEPSSAALDMPDDLMVDTIYPVAVSSDVEAMWTEITNNAPDTAGSTAKLNATTEEDINGYNTASPTGTDSSDAILVCKYGCGKEFSKPYLRNKHHKVHNPPHACTHCDWRFAVTRDL
jgi:hypothetical protein